MILKITDMDKLLVGPFRQLITMRNLPLKGAIKDSQLEIIPHAGVCIERGRIVAVDIYDRLKDKYTDAKSVTYKQDVVCVPGYVDCHTHIAFGGSRANDFALRNAGSSYLEIAQAGGGIWSTVQHTRACSQEELCFLTQQRADSLLAQGVTTAEVKSGYGLDVEQELKTLRAIQAANQRTAVELIATCLAAHTKPKDFVGSNKDYLAYIQEELFPRLLEEKLTRRIDVFVEQSAFSVEEARAYLLKAKALGFDVVVHADQFTVGGSSLAVELKALSADHLEASTTSEIERLAHSNVVAVALPAASLGLGCSFTPARKLLDAGAALAIATDWNPGSAPMGQLMTSASILAAMEKLTNAEVLAAITFRAADALGLRDRGRLVAGQLADFVLYATDNYQNITYHQGSLQPMAVWKSGVEVYGC